MPVILHVEVNVVWAAGYMILKLSGDLWAFKNLHVFGMLMAFKAMKQNEITKMICVEKQRSEIKPRTHLGSEVLEMRNQQKRRSSY